MSAHKASMKGYVERVWRCEGVASVQCGNGVFVYIGYEESRIGVNVNVNVYGNEH